MVIPNFAGAAELGRGSECVRILVQGVPYCWGANTLGEVGDRYGFSAASPVPVYDETSVSQLWAGAAKACDQHEDGTIMCWGEDIGDGTNGATAIPTPISCLSSPRWRSEACPSSPAPMEFVWMGHEYSTVLRPRRRKVRARRWRDAWPSSLSPAVIQRGHVRRDGRRKGMVLGRQQSRGHRTRLRQRLDHRDLRRSWSCQRRSPSQPVIACVRAAGRQYDALLGGEPVFGKREPRGQPGPREPDGHDGHRADRRLPAG